MHLVLTVTRLELIAFLRASPLLSAVCCWSWLLSVLMFPLSPAQPMHLCIYLPARRAEQCSPVPLRWVQLGSPSGHSCSSGTVSPWLEAWFGGEVRKQRPFLQWRIKPVLQQQQNRVFDVAATDLYLRSKKSRSCLNAFLFLRFSSLSFGYPKTRGSPEGGQVSSLAFVAWDGTWSLTGWNKSG